MTYIDQKKASIHSQESVSLALQKGGLTEEEYEAIAEAARWRNCPRCGKEFHISQGFAGPVIPRRGFLYCSANCVEDSERENAPISKPQPTGIKVDGWDV